MVHISTFYWSMAASKSLLQLQSLLSHGCATTRASTLCRCGLNSRLRRLHTSSIHSNKTDQNSSTSSDAEKDVLKNYVGPKGPVLNRRRTKGTSFSNPNVLNMFKKLEAKEKNEEVKTGKSEPEMYSNPILRALSNLLLYTYNNPIKVLAYSILAEFVLFLALLIAHVLITGSWEETRKEIKKSMMIEEE